MFCFDPLHVVHRTCNQMEDPDGQDTLSMDAIIFQMIRNFGKVIIAVGKKALDKIFTN